MEKNYNIHKKINTAVGVLTAVVSQNKLIAILWENHPPKKVKITLGEEVSNHPVLLKTEKQLQEYFSGTRNKFNLPLEFRGTDFQIKVWKGLEKIPFGKTMSYGKLAELLKSPKAVRAVGGATGRNPLSIVIPCHRLIGKNGSLTGFAGGLAIKEQLLRLEALQ